MGLGLDIGYGAGANAQSIEEMMRRRIKVRDLEQQQARDLARTDLAKQGIALDRQALIDRNAATVADEAHRQRVYGLSEREFAQAGEAAQAEALADAASAARDQERIDLARERVDLSRLSERRLGDAAERSAAEAAAARAREASEAGQARQEALAAQQALEQQRGVWESIVQTQMNPFTGQPASPELVQDAMRGLLGLREISRSQGGSGGDAIDQIVGQLFQGETGGGAGGTPTTNGGAIDQMMGQAVAASGAPPFIGGVAPMASHDTGRQVVTGLTAVGASDAGLRQRAIAFLQDTTDEQGRRPELTEANIAAAMARLRGQP